MITTNDQASQVWIPCTVAQKILNVGRDAVERLAESRVIGSRQLPGMPRRYLRADVERVARESTHHAMVI